MDTDEIAVWNRAAMHSGAPSPQEGDRALTALLLVHGLVMNGGVLHAVEAVTEAEFRASCAGFRYFGLARVAELLEAANLFSEDWTDDSGLDGAYAELVDDETIGVSFCKHMAKNRELYAP